MRLIQPRMVQQHIQNPAQRARRCLGIVGATPEGPHAAFSYHFSANLFKKFMAYAQKQTMFFDRMKDVHELTTKDMGNLTC